MGRDGALDVGVGRGRVRVAAGGGVMDEDLIPALIGCAWMVVMAWLLAAA